MQIRLIVLNEVRCMSHGQSREVMAAMLLLQAMEYGTVFRWRNFPIKIKLFQEEPSTSKDLICDVYFWNIQTQLVCSEK